MREPLLVTTPQGLYCPKGDFYIDPWRKVKRAVITHAHSDHARPGSQVYLSTKECEWVLKARLGKQIQLETLPYQQPHKIGDVWLTFFPAGHILGSAQVRIESAGEIWVVSGDYKTEGDPTCLPFEPVECHTFITESTFGLPIYQWKPQAVVLAEINDWWATNAANGIHSVLYGYSLGKTQRILHDLDPAIGKILVHSSIATINEAYQQTGVSLPDYETLLAETISQFPGSILLLPPGREQSRLLQKLPVYESAFASGWMATRKQRIGEQAGFVLSDHADWQGLLAAIRGTGAEQILVTHGFVNPFVRWLQENGWNAAPLA